MVSAMSLAGGRRRSGSSCTAMTSSLAVRGASDGGGLVVAGLGEATDGVAGGALGVGVGSSMVRQPATSIGRRHSATRAPASGHVQHVTAGRASRLRSWAASAAPAGEPRSPHRAGARAS